MKPFSILICGLLLFVPIWNHDLMVFPWIFICLIAIIADNFLAAYHERTKVLRNIANAIGGSEENDAMSNWHISHFGE